MVTSKVETTAEVSNALEVEHKPKKEGRRVRDNFSKIDRTKERNSRPKNRDVHLSWGPSSWAGRLSRKTNKGFGVLVPRARIVSVKSYPLGSTIASGPMLYASLPNRCALQRGGRPLVSRHSLIALKRTDCSHGSSSMSVIKSVVRQLIEWTTEQRTSRYVFSPFQRNCFYWFLLFPLGNNRRFLYPWIL